MDLAVSSCISLCINILVSSSCFFFFFNNDRKRPTHFCFSLANLTTSGERQTRDCGKNCSHLGVLNSDAKASVSIIGQDPSTSTDYVSIHLASTLLSRLPSRRLSSGCRMILAKGSNQQRPSGIPNHVAQDLAELDA